MGHISSMLRAKTETLPGGRFPMPDKRHARLALQMEGRAKGLTPADKAKIETRANSMLGK